MTTSEKPSSEAGDDPTREFEASRTLWDEAARPEPPEDPVLGRWLGGRFRVLSRIGEGGMGSVYEVVDREGRRFAAKVISVETVAKTAAVPVRGSDADWKRLLQRFVREAAAAREVRHQHVVKTIELGVDDELGLPFIVMELLSGTDLGALIRKSAPLAPEVVARIGVEAARGLAAVHAAGFVHRDVKPSNIFLHTDVDVITVKVCDFGIAKQLAGGDQTSSELTHTGGVLGSPRYMSPEQVTNARDVDATADVYGLCASLYEAASGRALWTGRSSLGELIVAICTERLPELFAVAPWVPRELGMVVGRGLLRARRRRWQAMNALADALSQHAPSAPLKVDQLRTHDTGALPATESADPMLSSVDALDPGFQTQGVGANVAVAVAATAPAPVAPQPRRRSSRARATYAVLALAATAVFGYAAFTRSRAARSSAAEAPSAPTTLRVTPPEVTVHVNGRPAPEATSAPPASASAKAPSTPAFERAPKPPRGKVRPVAAPPQASSEPRSDKVGQQPPEPKPTLSALPPVEQWR